MVLMTMLMLMVFIRDVRGGVFFSSGAGRGNDGNPQGGAGRR